MNVFDFDKTIFYPDSSYCFVFYCLKHHTGAVLKRTPAMLVKAVKKQLGLADTKELKETVFSFLKDLKEPEKDVENFWNEQFSNVRSWYRNMKKDDDLVISASPEFLIRPCCDKLGIESMGTRMDIHTGKIDGKNCHDEEKVVRFREKYPDGVVDEFYSDSHSDDPMARLAKMPILVVRDKLCFWGEAD